MQKLIDFIRTLLALLTPKTGATKTDAPKPESRLEREAKRFERCVEAVLAEEGGYSNHPRDPGGETNFGVSDRGDGKTDGMADIDGDGIGDVAIKTLSREQAKEVYRRRYWNAMRCGEMPDGLDLLIFDFGVNAGPGRAVKFLQAILGVKVDGGVGPITLAALEKADPKGTILSFHAKKLAFYEASPNYDVFGRGWKNRAEAIRDAAIADALAAETRS